MKRVLQRRKWACLRLGNGHQAMRILWCMILLFTCIALNAQTPVTPVGDGSESSPYQVGSLDNLYWIADQLNNSSIRFSGKYFIQTADIDASATSTWFDNGSGGYYGWQPIGIETSSFSGSYDGQDHIISNLYINRPDLRCTGLFGAINASGLITRLSLTNASICGGNITGGITGLNSGTVSYCSFQGAVTSSGYSIGGLAGFNQLTITHCETSGTVSSASNNVGGLVGVSPYAVANMSYCHSSCTVSGVNYVGGLIGNTSGPISNSYFTGDITGSFGVGGLVGSSESGDINNCYSTGRLTCYSNNAGGILGAKVVGNTKFCYATGKVSGTAMYKGGLISYNMSSAVLSNCLWDINATGQDNCYSANTGTATDNTGLSSKEMKVSSHFTDAGWSETDWYFDPTRNNGLPYLRWQTICFPTLATSNITKIDETTFTMGGTVTDDGSATVTERGVVYSSDSEYPAIGETGVVKVAIGSGTGSFSQDISGLTPNKIYYVRAYATNKQGTVYGDVTITEMTFSWATPQDITYGTALSNTQLNASSAVPGSFSYSPESGTILNSGNSQTLTVTFTPSDQANYSVITKTVSINVTKATLTVTDPDITLSKVYDGTTTAAVTCGTLSGVVSGDEVIITAEATYNDANVATGKTITVHYTLSGADAGNYTVPADYEVTAGAITKAQLYVTGVGITNDKNYDGTKTAEVYFPGALNGAATIDAASISYTITAAYASANASDNAINILVQYSFTGVNTNNYYLPGNYTKSGHIYRKQLTVTDPVISLSKVYDGNTTAAVTCGTLSGVISAEDITLSAIAVYDNAVAGTGKTITVTYSLGGTSNTENYYAPDQFVVTTGEITKYALAVTAKTGQSKIYGDTDPLFTYTVSPVLPDGDSFTGTLSRVSGENIGKYAIETGSLTAGSNYEISFTGADFEITPRQLAVTDPALTTVKQYDGTTVAAVTAGTLSGVIASDNGNVTLTAEANYDNASVGTGKTITVKYTPEGSASGNYLTPEDYIVYTGVIIEKTTISELLSPGSGCEGGTLTLSYTILTGEPVEYQIVFGETAITAGFTNIAYTEVPASSGTGIITFTVPEGLAYGTYTAQLQLRNSIGGESELYPFTFTINLSSDYLVDKFDDVVLCDNSSGLFTAYQWYKDDALVSGATGQYYCDPQGLSGTYCVQVTTQDGKTLKTCPATYSMVITGKAGINVYPNPAISGQQFTVEISGVADKDLTGAVLQVYNMQGIEVYKSNNVEALNYKSLNYQSGNYLIRVTTASGKTLSVKMTMMK